MSLLGTPPTTTKYSFQRGDNHMGVWAIQTFLNSIGYNSGIPDGDFGPATEAAVKLYQQSVRLTADGVVGPASQQQIVRSCVSRAPGAAALPVGLADGLIDGESGRFLAAVNWSVAGGVDEGLTQRRVYMPFKIAEVQAGFNPRTNVNATVKELTDHYATFRPRVKHDTWAWRLAALAHNWPWAAETLSKGGSLSTTQRATWAGGAKFHDGTPVVSYLDWAQFYALGSHAHNDPGLVTKLAFGVPASD